MSIDLTSPANIDWLHTEPEEEPGWVAPVEEVFGEQRRPSNERRKSYVDIRNLKKPDRMSKSRQKVGRNFEMVDDLLMEAFEKQIWADDMRKAPNMWRRDDEVPQFVRTHVKEAIEDTDTLWGDYDAIPGTAALQVHKILNDQLTSPSGWSIEKVARSLYDQFKDQGMELDQAENIARTEIAAVLNKARELAYESLEAQVSVEGDEPEGEVDDEGEALFEHVGYYWSGPDDEHTTKICDETKEEIEKRGGTVTKDELKEILYRKAKKYEGTREGGTPERVNSFVPHYNCRHTFIRENYQSIT